MDRPRDLKMNGDNAQDERHAKEGGGRAEVRPAYAPAPPPGIKEENSREHDHRSLAEHGGEEPQERLDEEVPAMHRLRRGSLSRPVVPNVRIQGHQKRRQRQRVLEFGRPCDRLDNQGMDRKEHPAQPGVARPEGFKQAPDQECAEQMQADRGQMVAEQVFVPQVPLDPQRGRFERVVVGCRGSEPDPPQSRSAVERGIVPDLEIVPQPVAVKGR